MNLGIILLAVFLGVTAACLAVAMFLRDRQNSAQLKHRLGAFTDATPESCDVSVLREPVTLIETPRVKPAWWSRPMLALRRVIEQADVALSPPLLLLLCGALALVGVVAAVFVGIPGPFALAGAICGALPLVFLWRRRRVRFQKFATGLPDALDLIARALRAGHSLASGIQLVSQEVPAPIGTEFQRTYDEQNLGVPLDVALDNLSQRIPNVDLRFFVTAVAIQRQVGGDLAEVLDKLGYVIRERFKIYGQVRALTAEGRMSGWGLNGLPIVVFLALLKLNPDYVKLLFDDPIGQNMLFGTVVLQIIGALAIRKIVNIRV